MERNGHKSAWPLQPLNQVQGSATEFLTCKSKPRDHIPEVHAQKSDTQDSPDWPDDPNKIKTKENKMATPTNRKTVTRMWERRAEKSTGRQQREISHCFAQHSVRTEDRGWLCSKQRYLLSVGRQDQDLKLDLSESRHFGSRAVPLQESVQRNQWATTCFTYDLLSKHRK